jgi:hypothetical protein
MSFVEAHAASADLGGICAESRPVLARTDTNSVVGAVRVAAEPAEIGGVPTHNLPSMPYRRQETMAAQAPDYEVDDEADEPLAPPAPRARYSDVYQRDYYSDRGYAPRDSAPPPGWQNWQRDWRDYPPPPPPRYRWYSY